MNVKRSWTVCAVMGLVLLSGCASYRQAERIGSSLTSYNLAAAKAQNEVLFINIVRSMLGEPKQFTAVTQLRRAAQSGSISFGVPFGGGGDEKYSVTPNFSGSIGPSADVTVLDSNAFVRGLLTPISLDLVDYFLKQGWPPEFVWMLLLRDAHFADGSGKTFVNRPQSLDEFHRLVKALIACNITIKREPAVAFGPRLAAADLRDPEKLAALAQAKLKLKVIPSAQAGVELDEQLEDAAGDPIIDDANQSAMIIKEWQVQQDPNDYYISLAGIERGASPVRAHGGKNSGQSTIRLPSGEQEPPRTDAEKKAAALARAAEEKKAAVEQVTQCRKQLDTVGVPAKGNVTATFTLRSTEGVIYYLGQLMRAQVKAINADRKAARAKWEAGAGDGIVQIDTPDGKKVLFRAREADVSEREGLVRVRYRGVPYLIPEPPLPGKARGGKDVVDFTPSTLSFLVLLFGLTKEAEDLPRTGAVEVIG